ncbi:hypothetical protein VSS74_07735 [Conexibacter stalactiti]|uniref:Uncharacterized protein n=1 Tax=Conexibacter stalactiti TaxID=1940611 RepID=A0ABU4HLP3_9ACTN|nr:hypothetical protein [Conexibacter stalactiti]MDW5594221.1 hypothetical protein [Conexibacter stalactiti]MEC5034863.1 hypothetical protein [Conexibacter stalactiti]
MPSRLRVLLVLAILSALPPAAAMGASRAARPAPARLTLTQVRASGARLTIQGRATLPTLSARQRRGTRVALTLKDARRGVERFSAPLDARRAFKLTRTTRLSGRLSLTARVTIAGKPSGRALSRTLTVSAASRGTTGPGAGGGSGGGSGTTTPGTGPGAGPAPGGSPIDPGPNAPQGTPLLGTFAIEPGVSYVNGTHSGSWFQMVTPVGSNFVNADSRSRNKEYTLLDPGTDGGLRTDVYQPAPTPAFDPTGAALANRIVQPTKFFGQYFSIVTAPQDAQLSVADPLPAITVNGGRLSGQVTAWAAQWNGNWFNQGTPKPDGSVPGASTAVSGTYDAASGRFLLEWKSLIVTGPFDKFIGSWHLAGTFRPAQTSP